MDSSEKTREYKKYEEDEEKKVEFSYYSDLEFFTLIISEAELDLYRINPHQEYFKKMITSIKLSINSEPQLEGNISNKEKEIQSEHEEGRHEEGNQVLNSEKELQTEEIDEEPVNQKDDQQEETQEAIKEEEEEEDFVVVANLNDPGLISPWDVEHPNKAFFQSFTRNKEEKACNLRVAIFPTLQIYKCQRILEFRSKSKPVLFHVTCKENETEKIVRKKLIFKNEDLQRETGALLIISVINSIFEHYKHDLSLENGDFVEAFHYKCGQNFIECIDKCRTVYDITYGKVWKNSTMTPKYLNNLFRTAVGSSIAALIIKLNDRHMENILVNEEGKYFHIDFGASLGNRVFLEADPFAIPLALRELFDQTKLWDKFKIFCLKAYEKVHANQDLIRKYMELVFKGLKQLHWEEEFNKIFQYNFFKLERDKAQSIIENLLENSHASFWKRLKDGIHYVKKGYDSKDSIGYDYALASNQVYHEVKNRESVLTVIPPQLPKPNKVVIKSQGAPIVLCTCKSITCFKPHAF